MNSDLLSQLQCPACRAGQLALGEALVCVTCGESFPQREGIWDLVPATARQPIEYWEEERGHRQSDHPVVGLFAQQRWRYLEGLMPLQQVVTALDVGAGNGFSTRYAPERLDVVATDAAWMMLSRNPAEKRLAADALHLPFRDRSFDLVYCWELLHHVSDPAGVLAEMARVSKRWVVFFEPNPLNPGQVYLALVDPEHRATLSFSRRFVRSLAKSAGLEVLQHHVGGAIFPNRCPSWLAPLLHRFPYAVPLLGISQVVIAERAV